MIPSVIEQTLRGERKRRLEEIIAHHTKQPIDKISKDMERDYYMSAADAHSYGHVDAVITHH